MTPWWRLYYDDGSVFTSADGPPEASPGYGVQAVLQNVGNHQLISQDYYVFREDYGCWIEVKLDGLIDHVVSAAHQIRAVRAGRTLPAEVFERILRERVNPDKERLYGNR